MSVFDIEDYDFLSAYVFRDGYAGYKPTVVETPNADGRADNNGKRYAHIATKYFKEGTVDEIVLMPFLKKAHAKALAIAETIRLPKAFWPHIDYGALRVLDYPPGSTTVRHEDADLFTVMCYRDQPDCFRSEHPGDTWTSTQLKAAHEIDPQCHFGKLGEELGLAQATMHEVVASERPQHSIVYFAIPDHKIFMPGGSGRFYDVDVMGARLPKPEPLTVRDWLNERMARMRSDFKKYE